MDELNLYLQSLIEEACSHSPASPQRNKALDSLFRAILKSGRIWKPAVEDSYKEDTYKEDIYEEALSKTMFSLNKMLCDKYDPSRGSFLVWFNTCLSNQYRDEIRAAQRHRSHRQLFVQQSDGVESDPLDQVASGIDATLLLGTWESFVQWIKDDPDNILKACHIENNPKANCQLLAEMRLVNGQEWQEIAKVVGSTRGVITSHWSRKCEPLLREWLERNQGLFGEDNEATLLQLKTVVTHLKKGSRLKAVAYQALFSENLVNYQISITTSQSVTTVAGELELSINLKQSQTIEEGYLFQITQYEATGNELNIFLTAPGFHFNSDNSTSLPLDPDTANITQTATFNLTALRPGTTKIKAELYCGETYKITLETEVEVTAFEETELRPLIAARSRPVPQPDIILQVRTTLNADISACTFNYHIDSYQPRLLFADDVDYNSQSLSATWVERSHSLLKATLEEAATSLREDFRSRLVSLGQYLFQSLLPEELQNTFRTIASFNQPFSLLILADQDAWFPWELLHDGQKFLGDRFIIGRWLWELEKSRPYEFPVGAVNVAHYASVEQSELWTELLHSSGAPPPISMQAGIFNDITLFESIRGLHLICYGQSVDTTNRQDAPVRVNSSSDIQDIEREVQPAKLSLRRNHPLVSLSYLNAGQPELTALEQTWASTFVRAGCSAFVGSLWAVQANVEAAFVSAFYNSIWAGQTLAVAFQTARRLAKTVVPESLDWLAYVLFGDPMARPYRPVQGQGYAVVEPIGQEIDDPVSPGSAVRFRVSLRRTPPVWYENRLMEVAEDLSFDDLRVFIVTSGLHVTPGDSILMTRTATGDYLGWFTLTAPAEMEGETVLVQVYYEDAEEPVHNLRFLLKIDTSSLPNYSQPRKRKRQQIQKQKITERGSDV